MSGHELHYHYTSFVERLRLKDQDRVKGADIHEMFMYHNYLTKDTQYV